MAKPKRKRKAKRTGTGHRPLFLGTLGLGLVELTARAMRNQSSGQGSEQSWRNAAADVIVKRAEGTEADDALTEAAECIRDGASVDQ